MNEWSEYISCTSIEIDDGAISYSHSGKYKGNLFNINQIKGGYIGWVGEDDSELIAGWGRKDTKQQIWESIKTYIDTNGREL